jgi:hypothetical protein
MPAWGNLDVSDISNRGVTFDINAAGNVVAHNQDLETIVVALPAASAGATGPLSLASVTKAFLGTVLINGSEVIGVNAAPVTATTLNGTITNSQTTIGVTTNAGMAKSDILLIGTEQLQISGATGFIGSTGLVVSRAYNSSVAAATGVNATVQDLTLNVTRGLASTTPGATGINVALTVVNVDYNNVTGNSVLVYNGTSVVLGATGAGYEYIVQNVTGAPFQTTTLNANIAATGVNANGLQIGVASTTGINVNDVLIIGATGGVSGEKVFVTAINGSTGLTVNRALFTAGGATGAGATVREVSSLLVTSLLDEGAGFLGATGAGSAGIGATGSLTAYLQQKPVSLTAVYDTAVSTTAGSRSRITGSQHNRAHVYGVSVIEQQLGRTGATGVGSPAYIAGVTASSYSLNGTITSGQTQIGLTSTVGISAGDTLLIGAAEQVLVGATGFIGSTGLLVTRAQNSTTAAATGVNANVTDLTLTGGRSYSSASTGYTRHAAHAGWVLQKDGAGNVDSVTFGATGTRYNGVPTVYFGTTGPNNAAISQLKAGIAATGALTTFPVTTSNNIFAGDTIQVDTEKMVALVSSGTGGNQQYVTVTRGALSSTIASHATGAFITNITGGASGVAVLGSTGSTGMAVASITITYPGMYSVNPPLVTLSAPAGTGSTGFAQTGTVVMGGRFGRKMYETLVAHPSISGDAENVQFPNV